MFQCDKFLAGLKRREDPFGIMLWEVSVLGFQAPCCGPEAWLSIMVGSIWWSKVPSSKEDRVMRKEEWQESDLWHKVYHHTSPARPSLLTSVHSTISLQIFWWINLLMKSELLCYFFQNPTISWNVKHFCHNRKWFFYYRRFKEVTQLALDNMMDGGSENSR